MMAKSLYFNKLPHEIIYEIMKTRKENVYINVGVKRFLPSDAWQVLNDQICLYRLKLDFKKVEQK